MYSRTLMAPTATGSKARWAPQATRVWAGAGPQRAAHTGGGGISWRPPAYSLLMIRQIISTCVNVQLMRYLVIKPRKCF